MFLSDLSKALDKYNIVTQIDFMSVSSYAGSSSTGQIKINSDLRNSITGKRVLIVEDILDTGLTLNNLISLLKTREPKSIDVCVLLNKQVPNRTLNFDVKYSAFDVNPDAFVVGYGLDYNEFFRGLPFIGIPKKEFINKYK